MKTPEELNALKKEVESLNKKLAELTEEELVQVAGGLIPPYPPLRGSGRPGFYGTFDGSAKTVKISIDPASISLTAATKEKDEQMINFDS